MTRLPPAILTLCLSLPACVQAAAEWPRWRGPDGQGHAPGVSNLPLTWGEGSNVTWRTEIPGRGWSSPVIGGELVWLTTALEKPATPEDAARRLKTNTGNQPLTLMESVSLRAVAVDRRSGAIRHDVELLHVREPQWVHEQNSYASPTPVLDGGRLYCHFGDLGNACLDTRTATVVWTNTALRTMHENGPGSTPLVWKDKFIFHMDGSDVQYLAALDTATGRLAWRTERTGKMHADPQLKKSYGTPLILSVNGQDQLISQGSNWLYAYDPADGRELWKQEYGALGFSVSSTPVIGHGLIYLSTGFMKPELLAIRPGLGPQSPPSIAWRNGKGVPKVPSPLLVGDELYFVNDNSALLTCLDAHTGAEIYKERLSGNVSASPLLADGRIYVCNREGETHVVQAGRAFKSLARNQLDGKFFASPVAVGSALYLRTDKALYRVEAK